MRFVKSLAAIASANVEGDAGKHPRRKINRSRRI
jgi:hypothetical protein